MANFTRKAIIETFIALLEEKPLSDITVKDIVETCGINRNSFYYHFQDLPALLEEIVKEEAEMIIAKYPSVTSIVECFDALIEFASHRKKAIMHIYRSVSREVFERQLMALSQYFVQNYVNIALAQETITDEDKMTIIEYYKCVFLGLTIEWLNRGMAEEFAKSVRRVFLIKKDHALEIAQLLKDQV